MPCPPQNYFSLFLFASCSAQARSKTGHHFKPVLSNENPDFPRHPLTHDPKKKKKQLDPETLLPEPCPLPFWSFPCWWLLPLIPWHLDVLGQGRFHLGTAPRAASRRARPCLSLRRSCHCSLGAPRCVSQGLQGGFLFISSSSSIHSLQTLPSRICQDREGSKGHLR